MLPASNLRSPHSINMTIPTIHQSWQTALATEWAAPYFLTLTHFIRHAYLKATPPVYPHPKNLFNALNLSPLPSVKVVILGQDPYHGAGQAHGLAFSVPISQPTPPSLKNIFKELQTDTNTPLRTNPNLTDWAEQGVLLLNATLTVYAHQPASHQGKGWETFTNSIIQLVSALDRPVVFILWGRSAQAKVPLIDQTRHLILSSPHPSPLSAYKPGPGLASHFFGSKPFSKTNAFLLGSGQIPIDWVNQSVGDQPSTQPDKIDN